MVHRHACGSLQKNQGELLAAQGTGHSNCSVPVADKLLSGLTFYALITMIWLPWRRQKLLKGQGRLLYCQVKPSSTALVSEDLSHQKLGLRQRWGKSF